jgi:hypothetical protein
MQQGRQSKTQDKLSKKIIDYLTNEAAKASTREKLRCLANPLFLYLLEVVRPYAIIVIALLTIMLLSQGVLCWRLYILEKHLSTI